MRIASIDMGSNSFLLLIARVNSLGKVLTEKEVIEVVRLGEGLGASGRFSSSALNRASKALKTFKKLIDSHNVNWTEAVTTSAARRASNFNELKQITDHLEIPLRVISGEEEARLTYLGATDQHDAVVVDVGGGSTEVVGEHQGQYSCYSFEFGSVRLLEKHISEQPMNEAQKQLVKKDIQSLLGEKKEFLKNLRGKEVVAVAGTPTTLAALILDIDFCAEQIEGMSISIPQLDHWFERLAELSVADRLQFKALKGSPKRADVIAVGLLCLGLVLKELGCKEFRVSTKGVRYGLVKDIFAKHSTVLAQQ